MRTHGNNIPNQGASYEPLENLSEYYIDGYSIANILGEDESTVEFYEDVENESLIIEAMIQVKRNYEKTLENHEKDEGLYNEFY